MKVIEAYKNIYLVDKKPECTARELNDLFPDQKICVCDFHIPGSEKGEITPSGAMLFEGLLSIDHHAALPEMMRRVSSTIFANKYVAEHGALDDSYVVVINHVDTDSVLSSCIMRGILEPDEEFNAAAIAADHTGEENILSDLLQSMGDDTSLQMAVEMLRKVLERRVWVRRDLLAHKDEFEMDGRIVFRKLDKKIEAGLVPGLFPDADAVILAWLMPEGSPGKWGIEVRLGLHVAGIALNELDLPDAAGRWNAVGTTRQGGTDIEPESYVKIVKEKLFRRQG